MNASNPDTHDFDKLEKEQAALERAWHFLKLPWDFPATEMPLWQLEYTYAQINSGLRTLAKKSATVSDPVAYLGTCLRKAKDRNMTPEEREAQIGMMRSAIGKIGAAKRHQKEIELLKNEFAKAVSADD